MSFAPTAPAFEVIKKFIVFVKESKDIVIDIPDEEINLFLNDMTSLSQRIIHICNQKPKKNNENNEAKKAEALAKKEADKLKKIADKEAKKAEALAKKEADKLKKKADKEAEKLNKNADKKAEKLKKKKKSHDNDDENVINIDDIDNDSVHTLILNHNDDNISILSPILDDEEHHHNDEEHRDEDGHEEEKVPEHQEQKKNAKKKDKKNNNKECIVDEEDNTDTDKKDKLCYYSKSAQAKAGKGTNEFVNDPAMYNELDKISNWRKILSNFYVEPFTFQGKTFNSVEHAFQGYKIATVDKEKGHYFTLESDHPIGKGDGSVAQKNRKLIIFNQEQLSHWDAIKHDVMTEITQQRIMQSSTYRNVLLLTNNAQLWHVMSRKGIIRNVYLEQLRSNLSS